jgi:hypothetical protein
MSDLTCLTVDGLRACLHASIADRLDAVAPEDRRRAGEDVLDVLDELARRGWAPLSRPDRRAELRTVPQARDGRKGTAELVLVAGAPPQGTSHGPHA